MSQYNHSRIETRIMEAVSTMIVTKEIKDRQVSQFASISKVELSIDNSHATMWVTTFEDEEKLRESVAALQRAAGYIQSRLRLILKTRNTPRLTFKADLSIKEGQAVNQLIESLKITDGE